MKQFLILVAAFVFLPTLAIVGCNAILGNQPGKLDIDASSGSDSCGADQKKCGTCVPVDDPKLGCGGACSVCPSPSNAQAGCTLVGGTETCGLGTCNSQFADCNSDPADGCETHTTKRTDCGSCGNDCLQEFCERQGDGYVCSATCDPPNQPCTKGSDTECTDPMTDNSNCGTCGNDCTTIANAVGTCVSGSCDISCNDGFIKCGSQCVAPNDSHCESDCKNCGGGNHCSVDPSHHDGQCLANGSCSGPSDCNLTAGEECCQGTCHAQGHSCGGSCASCVSQSTCSTGSCACLSPGYPQECDDGAGNDHWCCGGTDQCGSQAPQCIPQCSDGRFNCTQTGGGCGCNNTGLCIPTALNTDMNCGSCGISCGNGTCCCSSTSGGADAGVGFTCSGTSMGGGLDGGVSGCNCSG